MNDESDAFSAWLDSTRSDAAGDGGAVHAGGIDVSAETVHGDILALARLGHSPSARMIVNAGDAIIALAEAAAPVALAQVAGGATALPMTMRSRVLRSAEESARTAISPGPIGMNAPTLRSAAADASPEEEPLARRAKATTGVKARPRFRPPSEAVGTLHWQTDEATSPNTLPLGAAATAPIPAELRARFASIEPTRNALIEGHRARGAEMVVSVGPPRSRAELADGAIAQLLAQVAPFFDFEAVVVSSVEGGRTIHRVNRGLPPDGSIDVVPRELSLCTHTVSAGEPFVVRDTAAEPFFRSSAIIRGMGVRAYMGVPLIDRGSVLGSLCALSRKPHRIPPEDIDLLSSFSCLAQALVTYDGAAISALVVEPSPWPCPPSSQDASKPTAVLFAAPFFEALLAAQRARLASSCSETLAFTRGSALVVMPRKLFPIAVTKLPEDVVAGVSANAQEVALLVPPRHRAFEDLTKRIPLELDPTGTTVTVRPV